METHLKTICSRLARHLTVRVLAWADGRSREEILEEGFRVTKIANWLNFVGAPLSPGIFTELRRSPESVIHIHWPNPIAALGYLVTSQHKPLIVTWHADVTRQRRLSYSFAPILKRFLDSSSAIIVTSPNYLESSETLSSFRNRCRIIPIGIEHREPGFSDLEKARKIRETYGSGIVLTVGRLVHYKGLSDIIRAMREVRGTLIIVGEGPLRSELETQTALSGLTGRVIFAGEAEDVLPYYHACDVFALPSVARSEAFGIVQVEAMAAGKPVVNTAISSGVPFVSVDGLTGKTVPAGDTSAMAAALNLLLGDRELSAAYGRAGKLRARKMFGLEEMTRKTLDVYREVFSANAIDFNLGAFEHPDIRASIV
jgi:glycosyltransferase involved in cell wall biosynthesis